MKFTARKRSNEPRDPITSEQEMNLSTESIVPEANIAIAWRVRRRKLCLRARMPDFAEALDCAESPDFAKSLD